MRSQAGGADWLGLLRQEPSASRRHPRSPDPGAASSRRPKQRAGCPRDKGGPEKTLLPRPGRSEKLLFRVHGSLARSDENTHSLMFLASEARGACNHSTKASADVTKCIKVRFLSPNPDCSDVPGLNR